MRTGGWHFVVAGAGGNTGSHLLPHLARMGQVTRLTLVDPEVYTAGNLAGQNIDRVDVGRSKVAAQADRLVRIRPDLEITPFQARVEDVAWGRLRCDLFISCLDSRAARQRLNEIAWRMDTAWFDCGVLGSQDLVRVSGYAPAPDSPCLECAWDTGRDGEYAHLEQEYLCGAGGAPFPSMASAALGDLAASLLAIEIARFMHGDRSGSIAGRQVILDARNRGIQVTADRRNPGCRFDHCTWEIEPWTCRMHEMTVSAALGQVGSIAVAGHRFVNALTCPGCGGEVWSLRLDRPAARCAACDRRMAPAGFDARDRLEVPIEPEWLERTLAEIGLRDGDVVSNGLKHYQLVEAP
jgi:molybdopterin/thiamine biosynthesis adenylyltransferase